MSSLLLILFASGMFSRNYRLLYTPIISFDACYLSIQFIKNVCFSRILNCIYSEMSVSLVQGMTQESAIV